MTRKLIEGKISSLSLEYYLFSKNYAIDENNKVVIFQKPNVDVIQVTLMLIIQLQLFLSTPSQPIKIDKKHNTKLKSIL